MGYFKTELFQNSSQLKRTMATIINRSQNTVWCVYIKIPFLSKTTVISYDNNGFVKLRYNLIRIWKKFGLFQNGIVSKLQPIKAQYGHYFHLISNKAWRVYNKSLFSTNATVKKWSLNIILKLKASPIRITNFCELFISVTVRKIKPI